MSIISTTQQIFQHRLNAVYVKLRQRCGKFQRWFEQRYTTSKQRCHFQHRFSQRWTTLKQLCENDYLENIKTKPRFKNKIIFLSFKEYAGLKIFFILFSILRGIRKRRFARLKNP